jgi:hypothetical protein
MDVTICFVLEKKRKKRLKILDFYERKVGRSSGTIPTRVQILLLALFSGFIPGFSGVMR